MIRELLSVDSTSSGYTAYAVLEDAVLTAPATRWEPEQWGPGVCALSFDSDDLELNQEPEDFARQFPAEGWVALTPQQVDDYLT